MRWYRLSPRPDEPILSPREVLARFTHGFARVESDFGKPDATGPGVIQAYASMLKRYAELKQQFSDDLPDNPPPLRVVEAIWYDAIHMRVWSKHPSDFLFGATVNRKPVFTLSFSDAVSTKMRREIALRAAELLGYQATIEDECNEFGAEFLGFPSVLPGASCQRCAD